jgi:hypothetical protein
LTVGRVAAKRKNVLAPVFLCDLVHGRRQRVSYRVGAIQPTKELAFNDCLTLSSGTTGIKQGVELFVSHLQLPSRHDCSLSVQQRCMQVSMPMVCWHICTSDKVKSEFFPPAPLPGSGLLVCQQGP